jgi:hypothetical protein
VDDLRLGAEENRPAARANGGTQVDVFRVHEESRVETAGLVEIPATNEEAGAADPVHEMRPPRHAIDNCGDESPAAVVAANEKLLSKLRPRRDHRAKGELGATRAIHDPRADDRDVGT